MLIHPQVWLMKRKLVTFYNFRDYWVGQEQTETVVTQNDFALPALISHKNMWYACWSVSMRMANMSNWHKHAIVKLAFVTMTLNESCSIRSKWDDLDWSLWLRATLHCPNCYAHFKTPFSRCFLIIRRLETLCLALEQNDLDNNSHEYTFVMNKKKIRQIRKLQM